MVHPVEGPFAPLRRGQIRPTTSQTLYHEDWVGWTATPADRPVVARCFDRGEMIEGEISMSAIRERISRYCLSLFVSSSRTWARTDSISLR